MDSRHISRVFYDGEQYVSFYEIIKVIRDISDDFCEQDFHEACSALEWVAEQLQFAMIADGIRNEQRDEHSTALMTVVISLVYLPLLLRLRTTKR